MSACIRISCDGCQAVTGDRFYGTVADARREALREGWEYVGADRDLCPTCWNGGWR